MELREYMHTYGVSIRIMAQQANVCKATIKNYMSRKNEPSVSTAYRIERITGGLVTARAEAEYWEGMRDDRSK